MWYKSDPTKKDTDGDGINDEIDPTPNLDNFTSKDLESDPAEKIKRNKNWINLWANYYGIDPKMVAIVIYTEQTMNVNFVDELTDCLGRFGINTSVRIGQVRMSTAKKVEDAGYIDCVESSKDYSNDERYLLLAKDSNNIMYVAAYLKYLVDIWMFDYPNISKDPYILAALYNIGKEDSHSNPKSNGFGDFAGQYYLMMGLLLK